MGDTPAERLRASVDSSRANAANAARVLIGFTIEDAEEAANELDRLTGALDLTAHLNASASRERDELLDQVSSLQATIRHLTHNPFDGCDGCSTGDCPHNTIGECVQAQAKVIALQSASDDDLRRHIGNVLDHFEQVPCDVQYDPGLERLTLAIQAMEQASSITHERCGVCYGCGAPTKTDCVCDRVCESAKGTQK